MAHAEEATRLLRLSRPLQHRTTADRLRNRRILPATPQPKSDEAERRQARAGCQPGLCPAAQTLHRRALVEVIERAVEADNPAGLVALEDHAVNRLLELEGKHQRV